MRLSDSYDYKYSNESKNLRPMGKCTRIHIHAHAHARKALLSSFLAVNPPGLTELNSGLKNGFYDKMFTRKPYILYREKTFLQNCLAMPIILFTFAANTGSVVFLTLQVLSVCYHFRASLSGGFFIPHVPHGTTPHDMSQ